MIKFVYTWLFISVLIAARAQTVVTDIAHLPDVSKLQSKPNIILLLADDLSYNSLIPDRGPAYVNTPNINRIADEGIRFRNSFVTFSLCEPSRAQLLTGYYPHINGVISGGSDYEIPSKFFTLPQIMKANGYRTGFVGKYQVGYYSTPRPGWDYWFSFSGGISSDTNDGYFNTLCNLNGLDTNISYHMTDAIAHFTSEFLNGNSIGQPFFLIVSEAAPHFPYQPQDRYEGLFRNEMTPFVDNFYRYSINYPSYLYPKCEASPNYSNIVKNKKSYYELIYGMDTTAAVVFDYLTNHSLLKKTMIIFTSDNGLLFGEHHLKDKQLAYEESIRVPLYIRYPAWFKKTGRVDYKHLALNLDLFTTMLDAAGAVDTFNTHGISLHLLANNTIKRNLFMYERASPSKANYMPSIRAVRSVEYKYVKSYCNSLTEEFYDLENDPEENVNLIYNPNYTALINAFRYSLDSIRIALNDTSKIQLTSCHLENIFAGVIDTNGINTDHIYLSYENASTLNVLFYFELPGKSFYSIYDVSGRMITDRKHFFVDGRNALSIPLNNLRPGIYLLKLELDSQIKTLKFVKTVH